MMTRDDIYIAASSMLLRWQGMCIGMRHFTCDNAQTPGLARHWAVDLLRAHGVSGELLETAELLVSEVVTNSHLYADPSNDPDRLITVGVGVNREMIHIEVIDPGSLVNVPAMRPAEDEDLGGRGLALVHQLSREWGTDHVQGIGRAFWFRLNLAGS
ncbi:ATP-binding protein [Streptosporangium sp. NPDC050855]|uniref:ATP-binding protein n=1 Tax=Streptosporangium sp. NPDC050855 TaxID=3366194 RepID=UPI0037A7B8A1